MSDSAGQIAYARLGADNLPALAPGLSELDAAGGGRRRSHDHWRWRYLDNVAGGNSTVVALRDGQVIGKLGNVHRRFLVGGRPSVAGLQEGMTVLPGARGWQRYMGLLAQGLRAAADSGLAFGYAVVNRSAAELSARAGAVDLGSLGVWAGLASVPAALRERSWPQPLSWIGLAAQPFVGLRRRPCTARGLEVRPVDRFGEAWDRLWEDLARGRNVTGVRDAAYMNWRYVACPDLRYDRLGTFRGDRMEGLVVFAADRERHTGAVLELLADGNDEPVTASLLWHAATAMKQQGAGVISACFPAGSAAEAALKQMRFKSWATRRWGIHLSLARFAGDQPPTATRPEADLANWRFSLGDWMIY